VKLHRAKVTLLGINIVGGIAVLGSYLWGILANSGTTTALWGSVPASFLPVYTASMFAAAAGYLAFTYFILVKADPEAVMIARHFSYRAFHWLYVAILVPSAFWMPLTFAMLAAPAPLLWAAIRLVLAIVGLSSVALFLALLGTRNGGPAWSRRLAIVGSILFLIQTTILDAVVWPAFFPLRF
jgi:hypothetical protein